jgi:hypothetical protein
MTTVTEPIMLDSTGQDIVTNLASIVTLMGDGVIDDTATTAVDKTWSANKLTTALSGKQASLTWDGNYINL